MSDFNGGETDYEGMESDSGQEITSESGSQESTSEDSQSQSFDQGDAKPSHNPNWDGALSQLPDEFHKGLIPIFSEWDSNYKRDTERYAPYKQFADNNVDPQLLQAGFQLAEQLRNNPEELFYMLNDQFKFVDVMEDEDEDDYLSEEDEFDFDEDNDDPVRNSPLFQELQAKLNSFEEAGQQRELAESQAQAEQSIKSDIETIAVRLNEPLNEVTWGLIRDSAIQSYGGSLIKATDALVQAGILAEVQAPETHGGNGFPQPPRPKLDGSNDQSEIEAMLRRSGFTQ